MISLSARGFSTTQLAEEVEQFLGKILGKQIQVPGSSERQIFGWFIFLRDLFFSKGLGVFFVEIFIRDLKQGVKM